MKNYPYLDTEVLKQKTVHLTVLGETVSMVRIYFNKKSYITLSTEAFREIQKRTGRKKLKGLRAKVSFAFGSPDKIEIGDVCKSGLRERELKNLGKGPGYPCRSCSRGNLHLLRKWVFFGFDF